MQPFSRILSSYRESFDASWSDSEPLDGVRFIVLDCETTGLDPRRHRIVSIGAVGVNAAQIDLSDTFETLVRVYHNTETTPVHGITRDEARNGLDEPEAIAALLGYLRDGVIVGHHIGHDLGMINAAMDRNFGIGLKNRHLDTGLLTLQLEQDDTFPEQAKLRHVTLDALCARFDILPYDRHTAAGDAFLTAQVFLRLLRLAGRHGRGTLGELLRQNLDVDGGTAD